MPSGTFLAFDFFHAAFPDELAKTVKLLSQQLRTDSLILGVKNPRGEISIKLMDHFAFVNRGFALLQFFGGFFDVKFHIIRRM